MISARKITWSLRIVCDCAEFHRCPNTPRTCSHIHDSVLREKFDLRQALQGYLLKVGGQKLPIGTDEQAQATQVMRQMGLNKGQAQKLLARALLQQPTTVEELITLMLQVHGSQVLKR